MSVKNEAKRLTVACEEKRAAHGALYQALQKELPRACERVNARKLVPFVIKGVSWHLSSMPRQELKIYAGWLESRRTKKHLPKGVFSLKQKMEHYKILRRALIEELEIEVAHYDVVLFLGDYYKERR